MSKFQRELLDSETKWLQNVLLTKAEVRKNTMYFTIKILLTIVSFCDSSYSSDLPANLAIRYKSAGITWIVIILSASAVHT